MKVRITVVDSNDRGSYVEWTGDPGWLSMPPEDATWFHCGEWAGETIDHVSYSHPSQFAASHEIEVASEAEVLAHLIDDHGFDDHRRSHNGRVA